MCKKDQKHRSFFCKKVRNHTKNKMSLFLVFLTRLLFFVSQFFFPLRKKDSFLQKEIKRPSVSLFYEKKKTLTLRNHHKIILSFLLQSKTKKTKRSKNNKSRGCSLCEAKKVKRKTKEHTQTCLVLVFFVLFLLREQFTTCLCGVFDFVKNKDKV